ncbi:oligopeptide/dipeptide ABC transporter ATP-binding protein [Bacillus sp. JJ1773]|uniref:ABC transporter ATP-binding protein n=1 Tax=Bacillus sp. JJ1773 TaxID=3122965 RepID=UPI002FFE6404
MAKEEKVLVSLKNVKKYYPVKKKTLSFEKEYVKAVNGVTLDIIEGETMGVVGESGCGKSTLGRTIIQLEEITDGAVFFNGENIHEKSNAEFKKLRKDMQMIFQDPFSSLNPRQKIGNALREPMDIYHQYSKKERQEKVIELLKEVGLKEEYANRYSHEFSGGQRQRVVIGRAIALNPKFIVCDEPVSALDVSIQAQIIQLLQDLQEKHNLTYMFISHDLGVVRYICDRVLVMYRGNMAELAPVKQLYENPKHPYTKILLSAIPRVNLDKRRQKVVEKENSLDLSTSSNGCVFAPRCPLATSKCKEVEPEWRELEPGHFVACHEV